MKLEQQQHPGDSQQQQRQAHVVHCDEEAYSPRVLVVKHVVSRAHRHVDGRRAPVASVSVVVVVVVVVSIALEEKSRLGCGLSLYVGRTNKSRHPNRVEAGAAAATTAVGARTTRRRWYRRKRHVDKKPGNAERGDAPETQHTESSETRLNPPGWPSRAQARQRDGRRRRRT